MGQVDRRGIAAADAGVRSVILLLRRCRDDSAEGDSAAGVVVVAAATGFRVELDGVTAVLLVPEVAAPTTLSAPLPRRWDRG